MAIRKSSNPKNATAKSTAKETSPKAAAKAKAAQPRTPIAPAPREIPTPSSTPCKVTVKDEKGRQSSAGHPCPKPEIVKQKAKAEQAEVTKVVVKVEKAEIAARAKADVLANKPVSEARLNACTAADLHEICKTYGRGRDARFTGHSTLRKDDLVTYIATGDKPEVAKKDKKAPNAGTMEYNLDLLRSRNGGKGYTAKDTAVCKAMFGCTISTLKAQQLRDLVAKIGL